MPPKKQAITPFKTRCRARSFEGPDALKEDDVGPGEFRETAVAFVPIPKTDTSLTLQFRCTTKIVRGDTVTFRLGGFKGVHASVFTLESRPHPENKDFHDMFHAYWSGETAPKGGPPAQSVTLQCRRAIEANALVVLGVPDYVHIVLPEKLAANSAKIKIEGVIKHAAGGKIPKAPVETSTEIKKRPIDEDIADLENLQKEQGQQSGIDEDDSLVNLPNELTVQEADGIWEACKEQSELKIGLQFRIESSVFKNYEENAMLAERVTDNYLVASKKKIPLALHKELAANLQVKVAAVVMLEDCLYALHGSKYPELSRCAVMVLRLFTCEAHDVARLLRLTAAPCIYREINGAVRSLDAEVLAKWTHFIGILMTCCNKLGSVSPEMIPVLYRGVKELAPEQLQHVLSLKKDDWYVFPNFTQYVTEAKYEEEWFSAPDNAVLFQVHGAADGVELGDVSQYPEDREWMLPMFSSFSVVSLESLPDKNNMIRVVLRMRGSLAGMVRDELFPEEHRSLSSVVIRKAKTDAMLAAEKTQMLAKMIYTSIKASAAKSLSTTFMAHSQYLDKFGEVQRQSIARRLVEEGLVRWQTCPVEPQLNPDGTERPANYITENKKVATAIETMFLRMTRMQKQFQHEGITVDLKEYVVDYGKGPKKIRRVVGKYPTHPFNPN